MRIIWHRKFLIGMTLCLLFVSMLGSNTLCADLDQGLVAYYPFNGNANDASGNWNDGTVSGATPTADRFGNPNSAYSFDGTDDRIIVPDDDSLDITNAITLMAWIKPGASFGLQPVVVKRNLATIDFAYYLDIAPGTVRGMFRVDDLSQYGTVRSSYGPTGIIADAWQHIAVTYDSSSIRIYYNGQLDLTDTHLPSYPIVVSENSLEIGYYSSAAGVYFYGAIDEVRVYNRVLSEAEIRQLYSDTPVGINVVVQPVDTTTGTMPVTVTFAEVTMAGMTTLTTTTQCAPPPEGWEHACDPGICYDIVTTADGLDPVTVDIIVNRLADCEPAMSGISELAAMHLQMPIQQYSKLITAIAQIQQEWHATSETIIQNLRASHFALFLPIRLPVEIDIKPGSYPNSINIGSHGNIPVAILSTPEFDATTVDPATVTLASALVKLKGKGSPMASSEDVNGDGLLDLVVHVSTDALVLTDADEEALLTGKVFGGAPIVVGSDTVRVVP